MRILRVGAASAAIALAVGVALWLARGRREEFAAVAPARVEGSRSPASALPRQTRPVAPAAPVRRQVHKVSPRPRASEGIASQTTAKERLPPDMDDDMTTELQPAPTWSGPWPRSVAELPRTPRTDKKLAQFQSVQALDYMLGFLDRLRNCVGNRVRSAGGIYVELWFNLDAITAKATGSRVAIFQSALDPDDDPLVIECIERSHVGHFFTFEASLRPEQSEVDGYVVRRVLNIPIENEPLYSSLLGP
jgi:hypothetical protein